MRIIYPYNENLPKNRAHDVYIFNECAALSGQFDVLLLCGSNSSPKEELKRHYAAEIKGNLQIKRLAILRKSTVLNLSWNFPFFFGCQNIIKKNRPDWVFLSVKKQADYHLKRRLPFCRYLYEVHELAYYPDHCENEQKVSEEKAMLEKADIITVTTSKLKTILQSPPYSLKNPVEVIPLAVRRSLSTKKMDHKLPLTITYIGQLYKNQGIELLLKALTLTRNIRLKIAGGRLEEIEAYKKRARELSIENKVEFLGFLPPSQLPKIEEVSHAFVAPFENVGRMPFVAHTKLFEYAESLRPFIAPDLPIVKEHFNEDFGTVLFEPSSASSLASAMQKLEVRRFYCRLQDNAEKNKDRFSWEKRAQHYENLLHHFKPD